MTLYRYEPLDPSYPDPPLLTAIEGYEDEVVGNWVPVERTDRICTIHDHFTPLGYEHCYEGQAPFMGEWDCVMVDVVWLGEPA